MRIAEVMKSHEYGVLETTSDKLLIDFVTRTSKRPDSKVLKERHEDLQLQMRRYLYRSKN